MDFAVAGPHHAVGLSGQQDDILQRHPAAQTVEVKKGIAIPVGAEELKFVLIGPDAGFLKQLSGNSLAAGLSGFGGAAGIFPGAVEALALGPAGQKNVPGAVVDPDADHKTVVPRGPGGSTTVYPSGQLPVLVVNIVPFLLGSQIASPLCIYLCA